MEGSVIQLLVRALVHDKKGKLVSDTGFKPSRSFTIAFLQLITILFKQASVSIKCTDGTTQSAGVNTQNLNLKLSVSGYGIMPGTGTTPVDNLDYVMETLIADGSGAGELTYGSMAFVDPAESVGNIDLVMSRAFTNNSGGTITITEVGLYGRVGSVARVGMVAHDLLTVEILDTQVGTIQYLIRTTV